MAVSVCCLQLDIQRLLVYKKYTDHVTTISTKVLVFSFCESKKQQRDKYIRLPEITLVQSECLEDSNSFTVETWPMSQ